MNEDIKEPSIGISYQAELPGKRQVVLQSFVPRDCQKEQLDGVLDTMQKAIDRQFAIEMRDVFARQLEQEEKLASDHASRISQVDQNINLEWEKGNRRGDVQLSAKQRQDQAQAYAHAEECKRRIAKVKADIAANEAKIGA